MVHQMEWELGVLDMIACLMLQVCKNVKKYILIRMSLGTHY